MKFLISALILSFPFKLFAFPDMVRHGYTTCVTCHFSPSGGGLLTSYGKFIAGELFGAWNTSDDAKPWLVKPIEDPKYSAGILMRGAQTYVDTPELRKTSFKNMQFDLEAGFIRGRFAGFATVGARGSNITEGQKESDLKLRSFYLYHGSVNHAIRLGRFYPEYGLRFPNHNIPTRKGLYWNQGDEPFVAQASYYTTVLDYNIAYLTGAPETQLTGKFGFSGSLVAKTSNTRSGLSFLDMSNASGRTYSRSLFTQIGYKENGYTLAEYALKFDSRVNGSDGQKNIMFIESGWEIKHGFIPYVGIQRTHVLSGDSVSMATPIGFRFYPMTHAEIVCEYQPISVTSASDSYQMTAAFAMFNLYY